MIEKRCIAVARSILFNYGQGIWTPTGVFRDCCHLLDCSSKLQPIPDFQPIEIPISFFSKVFFKYPARGFSRFVLYQDWDEQKFLSLPSATKLCWMKNFYWMQELLFNFTSAEHHLIAEILHHWKRPPYDYLSIPFALARISTDGSGQFPPVSRDQFKLLTERDI